MKGVAVIGAGGLGQPAALALAQLSVPIALFDGDAVEASNLPRQILFAEADLGRPKAEVAAERLRQLVPGCQVEAHAVFIRGAEAERLSPWPVWLDGTDGFETKLWLSDLALSMGRILIHGGAVRLGGQALVIVPGEGPCLRCLVETSADAPGCRQAGILGPVVGFLGACMARLAFEALQGAARPGLALGFDAATPLLRERLLSRQPGCPACAALGNSTPRQRAI